MQVGDYVRVNLPSSQYDGMEGRVTSIYKAAGTAHIIADDGQIYAFFLRNLEPCTAGRSSSIGQFFKKQEALYAVPDR